MMPDPGSDETIEVVRGRMSDARADQLLRFWSKEGALDGPEARRRLAEVVCVLLDGAGEIAGSNSAYQQKVPLFGDRPFWMYRSFLRPDASSAGPRMIGAAFTALEEEFDTSEAGPIGLCLQVSDPAVMESRPEAIWPETGLMFAGSLVDGSHLRIRYFDGVAIGPGLPDSPTLSETRDMDTEPDDRYRIEPLGHAAGPDDVLAFWDREDAVPVEEARRRVHQVHLVAIERADGVVAVSTAYLQRNAQLRMDLWYFRVFVARAHRKGNLAVALALRGHDLLEQRFLSGEDTRGSGILHETEHPGLKTYFNKALWAPLDLTFIGENRRGAHVRVHYFPGALAPAPRAAHAPG